jgi:hypothetical protein
MSGSLTQQTSEFINDRQVISSSNEPRQDVKMAPSRAPRLG